MLKSYKVTIHYETTIQMEDDSEQEDFRDELIEVLNDEQPLQGGLDTLLDTIKIEEINL